MSKSFIHFDTETNAIDSLEKALFFYIEAQQNPINYKWVIISLFNSLYGFAVCASTGTNSQTVCKENKKNEVNLKPFNSVLELCKNENHMKMTNQSKHLKLTKIEYSSIEILKDTFRNNFEHFTPKSWSIEIESITEILPHIIKTIKFLALETGNYVLLDPKRKQEVANILKDLQLKIA